MFRVLVPGVDDETLGSDSNTVAVGNEGRLLSCVIPTIPIGREPSVSGETVG